MRQAVTIDWAHLTTYPVGIGVQQPKRIAHPVHFSGSREKLAAIRGTDVENSTFSVISKRPKTPSGLNQKIGLCEQQNSFLLLGKPKKKPLRNEQSLCKSKRGEEI